jgi:hypothetical protein
MFSASTIVRVAALAIMGPKALVVYLCSSAKDAYIARDKYSPEHTITRLIGLPGSQNSHIARESFFHEIGLAIELASLTRLSKLHNLPRLVHPDGDLSLLNESVCSISKDCIPGRNIYTYGLLLG